MRRMAGYFKKRRIAGPSKNEQKLQREREAEARERSRGRLGDAFPQVERLTVRLELHSPQGAPLAEPETRTWKAPDRTDFAVPCPGRCGEGSFNLEGKITSMIETHVPSAEASGVCQQPLYAGATEVCGVQLKCKIEVQYAEAKAS